MAAKKAVTAPRKTKRLELRPADLRPKMLTLLEKLRNDERLQEAFVSNPAKVLAARVVSSSLPTRQVSEVNRLLFALIGNDQMREFFSTYESSARGGQAAREEFASAFAKRVASLNDVNILTALVGNALADNGIPGLTNLMYQCVSNETTGKTSCACTPVAKAQAAFGRNAIEPETIRSLSEAMIARAKTLARGGALADLSQRIG